jgi:small subunit ribosomal protein S4
MKIGPKFKIARRLGAPIFPKTQTQKFKAASEKKTRGRQKPATNFGIQLLEKQKARFTYGVSEKQFSKYVKNIIDAKGANPHEKLFEVLETRLDNLVYRLGIAPSRASARQIVSHGHIRVNGKRMNIPSYQVYKNDVITIREGSLNKPIFSDLSEKIKDRELPAWIGKEGKDLKWIVINIPTYQGTDLLFDLNAVIQFYKR